MVDKRIGPAVETIPEIKNWYNSNIQRAIEKGWLEK